MPQAQTGAGWRAQPRPAGMIVKSAYPRVESTCRRAFVSCCLRPRPMPAAQDASELDAPFAFDGPPAPRRPAVITRDDEGRATVRAIRLTAPLRVDGRLDEAIYSALPPIGDFIQQEPLEGLAGHREDRGLAAVRRRALYVTFRAVGEPARARWSPTRCAATATTSSRTTTSRSCSTPSTTAATASRSRSTRSAAAWTARSRTSGTSNARLEPDLGRQGRAVRGRLDGRSRHAVQVAALPAGPRADLGLQRRAASNRCEERDRRS